MITDTTKLFVASWVNNYLGQRGLIGSVDPEDLDPACIAYGLDQYALDQLRIALIALRTDYRARKGHALAGQLIAKLNHEIRHIEAVEFKRKFSRRGNVKVERRFAVA